MGCLRVNILGPWCDQGSAIGILHSHISSILPVTYAHFIERLGGLGGWGGRDGGVGGCGWHRGLWVGRIQGGAWGREKRQRREDDRMALLLCCRCATMAGGLLGTDAFQKSIVIYKICIYTSEPDVAMQILLPLDGKP